MMHTPIADSPIPLPPPFIALLRLCALILAGAVVATARGGAAPQGAAGDTRLVLVMPFETEREPRGYWLGEGSAVLLTEELRRRGVDVIGRGERVRAFERLQLPSVATLTHGTVIRVGQLVGASSVIVGSLAIDGEEIVVRARSIRLDTGRLQAQVEERARAGELFELYGRVAARLVPSGAGEPTEAPPVPPLAAFESYVKGLLAETPSAQIGFLEKAIELFREYDAARLALWEAHTDAAQPERALAAAEAILERTPAHARAAFSAAYSEIQLKRHDEAYRRLQELATRDPAPEVFNNLGVIQIRRGSTPETGKATYWFNRAATSGGGDADYFFNLGYAYLLEEDGQAAIYWLREALRRDPTDADAHLLIAAALRAAGSTTEAARERELASQLSGEYERQARAGGGVDKVPPGIERVKSVLDRRTQRIDTALVAPAQREQRELASFHLERGRRLYQGESDNEAAVELRRAIYLSPYQPEAHLLLGRIYLRGGRTRDAIDAFKISLWSAAQVETHVALAEAYLQAHDPDAAKREVARALEMDPQAETALRLKERLETVR